ncbi:recombinase family protein [Clostridium sp. CX1]|uniref:recombinase family protein n=1 Tax=Clostridium sp. CX1 TaxID=2978346 RepID=UPI0021BEAD86|nr:recombinase family protein [Clostridium sp. CX1]MCT8975537.1 recombinase family protein [Clostridium sp. CX1]
MKKAALYVRVSTHFQIDKDSLPLQRQDLINYAKYILGIDDYEIFEDAGYSGKNTARPAYQDMMSRIRAKEFSHLLVWKIDRISRNLLNFCDMYEEIKRYGVVFVSKNEQFDTSSAMGEAMLKIILVFAELERKLTGERVTSVMLSRAEKGLWNGAPVPLGYKWDAEKKFPVPDEEEAQSVRLIYNKYLEVESTSALTQILNELGVKTKRDGTWTTKTISDIIRNPFYKGTYRYNYKESARGKKKNEKEWVLIDNNHEAIIPLELWTDCNKIMDRNAERNNAIFRKNFKIHIFAGLVECGECNNSFYAKQDKPNIDGFRPSLYTCSGRYQHLGCSQKTISDKVIGTLVFNFIINLLNIYKNKKSISVNEVESNLLKGTPFKDVYGIESECIDQIHSALNIPSKRVLNAKLEDENKSNDTNLEYENLNKEKVKFERALSRLEDLFLFDEAGMSEKDYILKKNKINEKLKEIHDKLTSMEESKDLKNNKQINLIIRNEYCILLNSIAKDDKINFKDIIIKFGRENIKDFMNDIIDKIIVRDRQVLSISFKNGLIVKFIYKA